MAIDRDNIRDNSELTVSRTLKLDANGLGLEIVLKCRVAHFAAPSRLLVSAERQRGVEDAVAINPNRACLD